MSNRKTTEQQDAIIAAYMAGATAREVAKQCHCSTATVRTVFKARGIKMPERKPGAKKKARFVRPHDILVHQDTYDHLRRIPDTQCACGRGCGLTFKRGLGQRSRLFAPGCPFHAEDITRKNTESGARRRRAKHAVAPPQSSVRGRGADVELRTHTVIHWCGECGGMPWRRPKSGAACSCGGFYREEMMTRPDGRVVTVGELPAERVALLGIVDKYQPAADYCETNRKLRRAARGGSRVY